MYIHVHVFPCRSPWPYRCMYVHIILLCDMYVTDQLKTWPVLKPSDGFKAGRAASKRARQLRNGPDGFLT